MWSKKKTIKGTTSLGFLSINKAHFCVCVNISSLSVKNTKSCSACKSKTEPAVSLDVWEFGYNESDVNYFNKNSILNILIMTLSLQESYLPFQSFCMPYTPYYFFSSTASICMLYFLAETILCVWFSCSIHCFCYIVLLSLKKIQIVLFSVVAEVKKQSCLCGYSLMLFQWL